jgi:hypothetical protein
MHPKLVGTLALVGGLLLAGVSGLADYVGLPGMLGLEHTSGYIGEFQWIGITAGAILFILGFTVLLLATSPKPESSNHA